MASFDTSKIVSDIKKGKIKPGKEPPKYTFTINKRGRKVKTINPRWRAWNKNKKNREIDKQVEKYVKDRKAPINKDLTKDFSKKKESGIGPIREGNKYAENLKINKKENKSKSNGSTTTDTKTKTDTKTDTNRETTTENKTESPTPKKKTNREKFNEKFIRRKGGRLARRGTPSAMKAEARERARKRAQAAAKLRIKKKKEAKKS